MLYSFISVYSPCMTAVYTCIELLYNLIYPEPHILQRQACISQTYSQKKDEKTHQGLWGSGFGAYLL
jgi:hypothetical protein